jgi:hypothetical protein
VRSHWIEERVKPSAKQNPEFRCCGDRRVVIPAPGPYPTTLHTLLSETEERSTRAQRYHTRLRHYNNAFAFCTLGVKFDRQLRKLQLAPTPSAPTGVFIIACPVADRDARACALSQPFSYNRSTASEVAALVPASLSAAGKTRNVIIFPTSGNQTIHYPLLCPFGETGWGDTYSVCDQPIGAAPQYTMQPALLAPMPDDGGDADAWEADEENENDEEPRRGRNGSTRVSQQQWFICS